MKILLLAGTGEARVLAQRLAEGGHEVLASLAGATREAVRYDTETRVGGFGGDDGFEAFLKSYAPDAVIDATHPFAARVSKRSAAICQRLSMPYLQLLRPKWTPAAGDLWHYVPSPAQAREYIPSGSTVFLATGRQTLDQFFNLSDCHLICRQIDPPDRPFPYPNGRYLIGRPPFSREDEIALFRELGVDVLVVKNAGGSASRSKLDAARELQIPVIMIDRPTPLEAETVATVEEALTWVERL